MIDAFNSISRYLDDLLNIDNIHFEQMVCRIYPAELQFSEASFPTGTVDPRVGISRFHCSLMVMSLGVPLMVYILNQSYKWPPFIFQASSESKNQSCKIYGSINKLRLCQDSGSNFITKWLVLLAQTMSE